MATETPGLPDVPEGDVNVTIDGQPDGSIIWTDNATDTSVVVPTDAPAPEAPAE